MPKKYLVEVRKAINQPDPVVFMVPVYATDFQQALIQVKQRYPADTVLTITEQES